MLGESWKGIKGLIDSQRKADMSFIKEVGKNSATALGIQKK